MQLDYFETPQQQWYKMQYFGQEAERICRHLDKLDRLPLEDRFDFRTYLGNTEFVYTGQPERS